MLTAGRELDMSRYGAESSRERERLSQLYCGTTGLDCGQVESEAEQEWLHQHYQIIKDTELEVSPFTPTINLSLCCIYEQF